VYYSCGRAHATALSSKNRVWVFTNWGAPCVLTTHLLSTESDFSTPLQTESGWTFSAVLTRGGDVYLFWPTSGTFGELFQANNARLETANDTERPHERDGVVQCRPWEINAAPIQAPTVPFGLPTLKGEKKRDNYKLVKIAAGDGFLIGLTDGGHVLRMNFSNDFHSFAAQFVRPTWEYVSLIPI